MVVFKLLFDYSLKEKSSKWTLCCVLQLRFAIQREYWLVFYNLMHYHTSLDGYYYSHAVKRNTMNDNNRIIWIISIKNIFLIKPFFYVLTCRGFLVHFRWKEHLGLYHDPLLTFWFTKIKIHNEWKNIKFESGKQILNILIYCIISLSAFTAIKYYLMSSYYQFHFFFRYEIGFK